MRRGPLAVVAAASGLAVVLGFHPSGSPSSLALAASGGTASTSGAATGGRPTSGTSSTGAQGGRSKSTSSSSSSSAVPATGVRLATGATEQYGYGQLAVRVTVNGSKITKLRVVGLSTAESYSQQLAAQVIPMLRNEVLAAQSPSVNGISGATYTTEAYLYSIQSALDKLHVK